MKISRYVLLTNVVLVSLCNVLYGTLDQEPVQSIFRQEGNRLRGIGLSQASNQGYSVSLSKDGNRLAVGAPNNYGSKGGVILYGRSAQGTWVQEQNIYPDDAVEAPMVGFSISLSDNGNTVAVGGPWDNNSKGAAWIFIRASDSSWRQQGSKLVGSNGIHYAHQGWSVALSGDGQTLAVGAPDEGSGYLDKRGATWIFTRTGSMWSQQGNKLVGSLASHDAHQGWSVALSRDGNTLAVGGPNDTPTGGVWVFIRTPSQQWSQQGNKLVGPDFDYAPDQVVSQGTSVSLSDDGNTLAVGGPGDSSGVGATWIFIRSGIQWQFQEDGKLIGCITPECVTWRIVQGLRRPVVERHGQGPSVSLSGDGTVLAVGAPGLGGTFVFDRPSPGSKSWKYRRVVGTDVNDNRYFANQGNAVSLSGDGKTLVVGTNTVDGGVWVFKETEPTSNTEAVIGAVHDEL